MKAYLSLQSNSPFRAAMQTMVKYDVPKLLKFLMVMYGLFYLSQSVNVVISNYPYVMAARSGSKPLVLQSRPLETP